MNGNKKHQQKDRNTLNIIFKTIVFSVLLLYALTIIYLLFWGLLTSLKANIDFTTKDNKFGFPNLEYSREEFFKLKNYKLILEKFEFDKSIGYYWNGILVEHTTRNTLLSMTGNALFFALVQAALYQNRSYKKLQIHTLWHKFYHAIQCVFNIYTQRNFINNASKNTTNWFRHLLNNSLK